jgi:Domain of unknown function (DUF4177)
MQIQKWEYRTVKLDSGGWLDRQVNFELLDEKLNSIGEEGWELVNVIHVVNSSVNSVIAFLKRPA